MPFGFNKAYGTDAEEIASITGLPEITIPNGYTSDGVRIALSFMRRQWSKPTPLKLAYAYEQATHLRHEPEFLK
jgi:Asp-tRNA(Asn)/Glu-tRNA(Gln) amidotransferase A subunit family amidase